jgi:hypothetical protein
VRAAALALTLAGFLLVAGCGGDSTKAKPKPPPAHAPAPVKRAPGPGARSLEAGANADAAVRAMACEALELGNDYFDIRSRHLSQDAFQARYQAKYAPKYGEAHASEAALRTYTLLSALDEHDMDQASITLHCLG